MKEERYAELVNKSKTNSEAMLKLIITMTPLIRKYSKKLFFMEYEDAECIFHSCSTTCTSILSQSHGR